MERVPMTVEGHQALEAVLQRLKSEERPRIIQAIAEARAHGDLSENAEYHSAKDAQGMNEAKIADLEDKLGRADVVDPTLMRGHEVRAPRGLVDQRFVIPAVEVPVTVTAIRVVRVGQRRRDPQGDRRECRRQSYNP